MTKKTGFFKRLKALTLPQKQLFATALCQRMLPNYQLFSEVCEFGDPAVLSTALELLWQSLYDPKLKFNIDVHLQRLEDNTPEPADFEAYGVYPAMDAVVAISTLLGAIQGKIEEDIVNISKLSSSTVANYIEAISDVDLVDEALDDSFLPMKSWKKKKSYKILCWKLSKKIPRSLRNWLKVYAKTLSKRAYQISASASLN